MERECLAIKWALDSLRYYLLGRPFQLEMDHRALQWLGRMRDTNSRVTRWYLSLQPYSFTVTYRPGASNGVVDFLSRIPEEGGEGGSKEPCVEEPFPALGRQVSSVREGEKCNGAAARYR